jgi:hypothetical protein
MRLKPGFRVKQSHCFHGHSVTTLISSSSSTIVVNDDSSVRKGFPFDTIASLSGWTQPSNFTNNLHWLCSMFGEDLCSSLNDRLCLVIKGIARPTIFLVKASQNNMASRIRSRDDVRQMIIRVESDVFLDLRSFHHNHLAPNGIHCFIVNSSQSAGSNARAIEHHLSGRRQERFVDMVDFAPNERDAMTGQVVFKEPQKFRGIEIVGGEFETKRGKLRKFVFGKNTKLQLA